MRLYPSIFIISSPKFGSIEIDVFVLLLINSFLKFLVRSSSKSSSSSIVSIGLATLLEALEIQPATSITCQRMLEEGHVLAISPGGVREALFSDHHYQLIWKERKGFARVAIAAKTVS